MQGLVQVRLQAGWREKPKLQVCSATLTRKLTWPNPRPPHLEPVRGSSRLAGTCSCLLLLKHDPRERKRFCYQ